jgi:hypothetical protein
LIDHLFLSLAQVSIQGRMRCPRRRFLSPKAVFPSTGFEGKHKLSEFYKKMSEFIKLSTGGGKKF